MGRKTAYFTLAIIAYLIAQPLVFAQTRTFSSKFYQLKVVTVAKGLSEPWSLAWLPDGRMLVTEKSGTLRLVSPVGEISAPIKGVPKSVQVGQGGLLDVVLDPDFESNGLIYLSFTEKGENGYGTAVARGLFQDNQLSDVKIIFRQYPKSSGGHHFGGRLVFARDGTLFLTLGDRGQRDRVQNKSINRGQVIRIKTDGQIPKDNPFVGKEGGRPETWSLGHRNPQGAALNPETGELWVDEHGPRGGDEVNISRAGKNYGWPVIGYGKHYSGQKIGVGNSKPGLEQPVHYWDPSIAPSGMAFYTGDKFPKWKGNVLVGALKFQLLARLTIDGDKVVDEERILKGIGERIRDVRQGPDGYIYLLTDSNNGRILRIEPENN